jgi:N-sulfoglucosamine sulfohydrolase
MAVPDPGPDATHESYPNVVVFHPHDFGRELGCYGRQAHTPRLDALAEAGALFENHFCASPSCAPSRASFTTGLLPHNNGMLGHPFHSTPRYTEEVGQNPWKGWEVHEGIPTLPMYLNERGYETYLVGSTHTSKQTRGHRNFPKHPDPVGQTGDQPEPSGGAARLGARNIADVIESVVEAEAETDGPFYLQTMLHNAHHPYSERDGGFTDRPVPGYDGPAPEDIDLSRYFDDSVADTEGYDEATIRTYFADFYEDMYELDYAVGRVLDALEETGQREETLFVFVADHGINNDQATKAKFWNYELGIESALLLHYPGRVEGGQRHDALLSNVDVLPTILDLVDGRPPVDVDGRSFRPLVDRTDDREYETRDAVFVETTFNGGGDLDYDPVRGIRTSDYKLLRNFWPRDYAHSERDRTTEVELYDLREDPRETENLADDPAYADVRETLLERLRERLERDDDPVLDGFVSPQRGAFDVTL